MYRPGPLNGGKDPGAQKNGIKEKEVNLQIAKYLKDGLENLDYEVIMTRDDDTLEGLYHRAQLANEKGCDIFVSIHNNAAGNESAAGSEVLYYPESENGRQLAHCIQKEQVKALDRPDRGLKPDDDFVVLNSTAMPAVIVESLFITNPIDRDMLSKKEYLFVIAESIKAGIVEYDGIVGGE